MSDLQNTKLRKLLRNARMVKDNNARIVQTLVAQVDRLTADRDAWRKLVVEHNARCIEECDVVGFGCDGPMRCLDCPLYRCVDIPPELEQSP